MILFRRSTSWMRAAVTNAVSATSAMRESQQWLDYPYYANFTGPGRRVRGNESDI